MSCKETLVKTSLNNLNDFNNYNSKNKKSDEDGYNSDENNNSIMPTCLILIDKTFCVE